MHPASGAPVSFGPVSPPFGELSADPSREASRPPSVVSSSLTKMGPPVAHATSAPAPKTPSIPRNAICKPQTGSYHVKGLAPSNRASPRSPASSIHLREDTHGRARVLVRRQRSRSSALAMATGRIRGKTGLSSRRERRHLASLPDDGKPVDGYSSLLPPSRRRALRTARSHGTSVPFNRRTSHSPAIRELVKSGLFCLRFAPYSRWSRMGGQRANHSYAPVGSDHPGSPEDQVTRRFARSASAMPWRAAVWSIAKDVAVAPAPGCRPVERMESPGPVRVVGRVGMFSARFPTRGRRDTRRPSERRRRRFLRARRVERVPTAAGPTTSTGIESAASMRGGSCRFERA